MNPSFSRIYTGSLEGNAYRCLFLFDNYTRLREVFGGFKEFFGDKALYSDCRYVATFPNAACVVFAVCGKGEDVKKFAEMRVSTVEVDE